MKSNVDYLRMGWGIIHNGYGFRKKERYIILLKKLVVIVIWKNPQVIPKIRKSNTDFSWMASQFNCFLAKCTNTNEHIITQEESNM